VKERIFEIVGDREKGEKLFLYYNEIKNWSEKINLISRKDIEGNFLNLLKTSIFLYTKLSEFNSFVDIGAGAGLPSIPGKILYPEKTFVLIEPGKRYSFLKHLIKTLSFKNIEAEKKSFMEYFSKKTQKTFDLGVSWGVKDKISILKTGRNFVKIGYVFITGPKEIEKMKKLKSFFDVKAEKIEGKSKLFIAFAKKVPRGT